MVWPENSPRRHISMAQAACRVAPAFNSRSTSDDQKASSPMLKTKAATASNSFWVSGV